MRALISFSSLLSAAICRLTSPLSVRIAALLHLAGRWPQVDRGDFINAPALVAAVVYQGRLTGGLQCPVGIRCPCRPPNLHIPFVVQSVVSSRWFFQPPFPSGMRWPFSSRSYALRHFAPHAPFSFKGRTVSMIWTWGLPVPLSWMAKSAHIPLSTKFVLHIGPDKGKLLFPG